jgi:hypothetical protein
MRRSIFLLIASLAAALTFAVAQASADVWRYSYSVDLTGQLFYVGDIPCTATAEPVLITSGTFELREVLAAGASPGDFTGASILQFSYRNVAGVGTITGTKYRFQLINNSSSVLKPRAATYVTRYSIIGPGPDNNLQVMFAAHVVFLPEYPYQTTTFERSVTTCR